MLSGTITLIPASIAVLNKSGIRLPFMVDLSVKLRDYDLIDDVELDMDRMIDTLWN